MTSASKWVGNGIGNRYIATAAIESKMMANPNTKVFLAFIRTHFPEEATWLSFHQNQPI